MSAAFILFYAYDLNLVIRYSFCFSGFLQDALYMDNCDKIRILMRFVTVLVGLSYCVPLNYFILPKMQISCCPSLLPILKCIFLSVACVTTSSGLTPLHVCL